jgi:hypothetical protein
MAPVGILDPKVRFWDEVRYSPSEGTRGRHKGVDEGLGSPNFSKQERLFLTRPLRFAQWFPIPISLCNILSFPASVKVGM